MAKSKLVKQWFIYSARDLKVAKLIVLQGTQFKYLAAFHAQQAVEKAIKGIFVFKGIRPPKIHGIEELGHLLLTIDPNLAKDAKNLKSLTRFAVIYRYPDAEIKSVSVARITKIIKESERFYIQALAFVESKD